MHLSDAVSSVQKPRGHLVRRHLLPPARQSCATKPSAQHPQSWLPPQKPALYAGLTQPVSGGSARRPRRGKAVAAVVALRESVWFGLARRRGGAAERAREAAGRPSHFAAAVFARVPLAGGGPAVACSVASRASRRTILLAAWRLRQERGTIAAPASD